MKKIISIILLTVISAGGLRVIAANSYSYLTDEHRTVLAVFDVIDDRLEEESSVTEKQFADMLAKVSSNTVPYSGSLAALDVATAVEMTVCAMGYGRERDLNAVAVNKNLYKNINSDGAVTVRAAYMLIYNMLNADITDLAVRGSVSKRIIYMSEKLGLYKVSGIVTDDGVNSLYGRSTVGDGNICIDNVQKFINETGRSDILGLNVVGFFKKDILGDGEYVLAGIYEKENKNNVYFINSNNIVSFENRVYTYYSDEFSSHATQISVAKDACVMYNNRTVGLNDDFSAELFIPENGIVKLYDNTGDGEINIVKIENYETHVVELADAEAESIYVKNGKPFIALSSTEYKIYDENGGSMSLLDISKDNVLSVMYSLDGKFCTIRVSAYTENDVVESYYSGGTDDPDYFITSSGGKYIVSSYVKENYDAIEVNQRYTFYFDVFDNVTAYKKDSSIYDWQYGYLIWVRQDTPREDYYIKVYNMDGEFELYQLNKSVKLSDENDILKSYKPRELEQSLNYTGLIRFRINSSEKITDIELPLKYGRVPDGDDRLFYLLDTVNHESKSDYYSRTQGTGLNIGGAVIATPDTAVFSIPSDTEDENEFYVGNSSSLSTGEYYSLLAYATNYKTKNASCIVLADISASDVNITIERPLYISSVCLTYDPKKDKRVYRLKCLNYKSAEFTYYMEEDVYTSEVKSIAAGNTEPVLLATGDLIYYVLDKDYISKAVAVYDADRKVKDEKGNDITGAIAGTNISYYSALNTLSNPFGCSYYTAGNQGTANAWKFAGANIRVFTGWVYSIDGDYMLITNQNPKYGYNPEATRAEGFTTETAFFNSGLATLANVGRNGVLTMSAAKLADVKPYDVYGTDCSRIVMTTRTYEQRSILIIN